jgi:hypothetical protein
VFGDFSPRGNGLVSARIDHHRLRTRFKLCDNVKEGTVIPLDSPYCGCRNAISALPVNQGRESYGRRRPR